MPLFGAHMSIAGGYHHALEAAQALDCEAVQLFTKSSNQWRAKPLTEAEVQRFHDVARTSRLRQKVAHTSYLLNVASPEDVLFERSLDSLVIELERAEALGLDFLVLHPGAHVGSGEEAGLERVAQAIDRVHERCPNFRVQLLLETTAGQGSTLGHRFEHLAAILKNIQEPDRVGVCLDTCHVFAAGYPLAPRRDYLKTMRTFDQLVGYERLRVFHLNDSLKPQGSRLDRHAHIGKGELGLEPFRLLVQDRRFRHHPMILETPKEEGETTEMDRVNLSVLRELAND